MTSPAVDLLVVSPHLDDAALSVGATLHALSSRGCRIVVATAFTADEPAQAPSEVARRLHQLWGGERVMARRRAEDEAACRILAVGFRHLGLADALHRCDPNGAASYTSLKGLFRAPGVGDAGVPAQVATALQAESASLLLAPLAVGGHVDHRHTREGAVIAAAALGSPILFYEDFPYAEATWSRWQAHRGLVAGAVPLGETDILARLEAIAAFGSQVGPLFGDSAKLKSRVRRQLKRRSGERLWTVPGAPNADQLLHRWIKGAA